MADPVWHLLPSYTVKISLILELHPFDCYACHEAFKVGEKVVTVHYPKASLCATRYYHVSCFNRSRSKS